MSFKLLAKTLQGALGAAPPTRAVAVSLLTLMALSVPALATSEAPAAPSRVVSMNLCTDQMAMLLAAPGQLIAVSDIATDPRVSSMADTAGRYHRHHGRAEEVHALDPDLVLAGRYTARAPVQMLQRLGIRVETFDIAGSLDDVRANLARMGELLGQRTRAAALIARFDADLAALSSDDNPRIRAAMYAANGYTTGRNSLSAEILAAAGLYNIAPDLGFPHGGAMPLEVLAMAAPQAIVTAQPYPGASRAEEILAHPVLRRLRADTPVATMSDADWVCETPHVLRAIAELTKVRRAIADASPDAAQEAP